MKSIALANIFNPYYVFFSGSLGLGIALFLFKWNYPLPGDKIGQAFVEPPIFLVWVFLFAIFFGLLTVFILPAWGMLVYLLKNRVYINQNARTRNLVLLFFQAVLLAVVVFGLVQVSSSEISSAPTGFQMNDYLPQGHEGRMIFIYIYTFLTVLPVLLGMIVIYGGAKELAKKIEGVGKIENKLFPLIDDLNAFRGLLQNYLALLGIIFSMIPINTAGLRAILIAVNPNNEQAFPITYVILFGLIFSFILLLIYIPAHLALTETSRKLRDRLCPLHSLASLKPDIEQRKILDELLQTNISITENLKTGLITLAPLASSLLTSLFKINISLP